mgnify:CR=1 FL=1
MDIEVFLNEHLQEADVVLLTPQRSEDLKEIKKVVKVPVGVISLRDYGLLDGSSNYKIMQTVEFKNRINFFYDICHIYIDDKNH